MFGSEDELPALTPTYDKRYIDLQSGHQFQDSPLPHGNYLLDGTMRAMEFDVLGPIAQDVPVCLFTFSDDIDQLFANCQRLIEKQLMDATPEFL